MFLVTTGWVAILVSVLAFLAHAIMTVQTMLANDPVDAANYAAARFLTIVLTTALIIVADQIVFFAFPPLFMVSIFLAAISAVFAILKAVFFASLITKESDDETISV